MILIADSGSTKTDWVLAGKDKPLYFHTRGLNPYYNDESQIMEEIKINLPNKLDTKLINEVHFYGAGCGTQKKKELVSNALKGIFTDTIITVNTDILGAARGLFGKEKGIACILGTGANSCFYDGEIIKNIVPSNGFIFGDEGSGSYLGKLLITHYLKKTLPDNICKAFNQEYNLQPGDLLDKVYRQPYPNRFLASFVPFIDEHSNEPFINKLVKTGFQEFVNYYIKGYKDYTSIPIAFTGSVAYHFKAQLEDVFTQQKLQIAQIIKSPLENLMKFHEA